MQFMGIRNVVLVGFLFIVGSPGCLGEIYAQTEDWFKSDREVGYRRQGNSLALASMLMNQLMRL
jgi:hypothetical protein